MDLYEAMRTTPSTRAFTDEAVPEAVLHRMLDHARFAPSGGNRQGWRVVPVRASDPRRRLRDLYLDGWYDSLAMTMAGLTAWAPVTDRDAEKAALAGAHVATMPAKVLDLMFQHPLTDRGLEQFLKDWEKAKKD